MEEEEFWISVWKIVAVFLIITVAVMRGSRDILRSTFDSRPQTANDADEAIWAMEMTGWVPMALDDDEEE